MMLDLGEFLPYLAPALGVLVSVGTLIFTGLSLLQKADTAYVNSLQARVKALEEEREEWDEERRKLHAEISQLSALLLQSTLLIRGDVAANTEVSRAAFTEANHAKKAIALAMEAVAKQTEVADARLTHLEDAAVETKDTAQDLRDVATQAAAALRATATDAAARLARGLKPADEPPPEGTLSKPKTT